MKKREINKQKQKLKKHGDYKMIRYAKNMCIMMIVLFLIYVSLLSMQTPDGFNGLFENNLFVVVGFIVCTANLYIWNELKAILESMKNYSNIESVKIKLIIICIFELILFNYATAILIAISLFRYFKWFENGIKDFFSEIKKTHQCKSLTIFASVMIFFVSLSYFIVFTAFTL